MNTEHEQHEQPPFYKEIFAELVAAAEHLGTANNGPLDWAFAPGNDGTLTPEGEPAIRHKHTLTADEVPQTLQEQDVKSVTISHRPRAIVGGEVWTEAVWVVMREHSGFVKDITFEKSTSGDITATVSVEADVPEEPQSEELPSSPISRDEVHKITSDPTPWLNVDGAYGEFARRIYLKMPMHDEPPSPDDIDLIRELLNELYQPGN